MKEVRSHPDLLTAEFLPRPWKSGLGLRGCLPEPTKPLQQEATCAFTVPSEPAHERADGPTEITAREGSPQTGEGVFVKLELSLGHRSQPFLWQYLVRADRDAHFSGWKRRMTHLISKYFNVL